MLKCSCCDATIDVHKAVNGGVWIPDFWDMAGGGYKGPTCPDCVSRLGIALDDNGEWYRPLGVAS